MGGELLLNFRIYVANLLVQPLYVVVDRTDNRFATSALSAVLFSSPGLDKLAAPVHERSKLADFLALGEHRTRLKSLAKARQDLCV